MHTHTQKTCPKCGQKLRIPNDIGGVVMVCPSCGKKLYSEFKLSHAGSGGRRNFFVTVFEMPDTILGRIKRWFTSR